MSEHQEQCAVIDYCELKKLPIFAIPNANAMSSQNRKMAMMNMVKLKKEGLKSGVPDLFLPVARGGFHGLFIEMKKPKTTKSPAGKLSDNQKKWIKILSDQGYKAVCCIGFDEAKAVIDEYVATPFDKCG